MFSLPVKTIVGEVDDVMINNLPSSVRDIFAVTQTGIELYSDEQLGRIRQRVPENVCVHKGSWEHLEGDIILLDFCVEGDAVTCLDLTQWGSILYEGLIVEMLQTFLEFPFTLALRKSTLECARVLEELRRNSAIKRIEIKLNSSGKPATYEMLLDNTNVEQVAIRGGWDNDALYLVCQPICVRNKQLSLLVSSFFRRLSSAFAPVFFKLLPPYVTLEIALWDTALQMAEIEPYFWSAEKHKERLEANIRLVDCIAVLSFRRAASRNSVS